MSKYVEMISCDVVVCGSGPAGIGAALAARRMGADVVLLESASLPGGTMCAVPWMPINRLYMGGKQRSKPHQMLVDELLKYGPDGSRPGKVDHINGDGISPHPAYVEAALYDVLDHAGVRYRMNSPVVDAIMDGTRVVGVVAREKQGLVAYKAKVAIDATGDADLAFMAGCNFVEGREEDGLHLPMALGFSLGGVEKDAFYEWFMDKKNPAFAAMMDRAEEKGMYVAAWYSFNYGTTPNTMGVNNGAWRKQSLKSSGLKAEDLTATRRNGVRIAIDLVKIFRENKVPGAENCYLEQIGNIVGVRDTRRIVGEYALTFEDSQNAPTFVDGVARKYGAIDANQVFVGKMQSGYLYPYRSMLPVGVDGLLVAGRSGSATFMGFAAGRDMGNMMEIGIAAGTAATIACQENVTPRAVDISKLRQALVEVQEVRL